jgi:HCOMODA/2-hydroxy-3-carboxy-muconic semialdehyde decarboxylase
MIPRRVFLASGAAVLFRLKADAARLQSAADPDVRLIEDLVVANRVIAMEAIVDAWGHVSVRHPQRRDRFFLGRSVAPELMTASDILEYDLDGQPYEARGRSSVLERFIHSEIYRARADVNAVVHCHAPSLIPFANGTTPLRPMFHMSSFVGEGVPVFDIRRAGGMTNMLVSNGMLGRALAEALGDKPAALMRGHGAVVVASSLPTVVGRSIYLELNARMQAQAMAQGGAVAYLDPQEAKLATADPNQYGRGWELWKEKVLRSPGFSGGNR